MNISTKAQKGHHEGQKLIFPVWNKIIWDTFWAYTNSSTIQQMLIQEAGSSGSNREKELQKPSPKLKKHINEIFTENICSVYNTVQLVFFCKHVLIL